MRSIRPSRPPALTASVVSSCLVVLAAGCGFFENPAAQTSGGAMPARAPSSSSSHARGDADDESDASKASGAREGSKRGEKGGEGSGGNEGKVLANLNVLLISVDSMRADMPWNGYARPIAPRLTELEKRSVSYTHAYALSSYTSMSLGGLLGGKYPSEMKRDGFFFGTYAKENLMFPEVLEAQHVHTLAGQAHGYFRGQAFRQGFERYEVVPDITFDATTDKNITSPRQEKLAEKLLGDKECSEGRFFAWFHFMDPHDQYFAHDEIAPYGKAIRDKYDAEVAYTDLYLGKLLDFVAAQPWGGRTAIIVTADHGEGFGEHHHFRHGFELWENLIRVPLFFVVPGLSPRRIDTPRSALDLAPTIVHLFGLPREGAFEGEDLLPEMTGAHADERDVIIDLPATSDSDRRRALVHGHTKIIAFGQDASFKVFDLEADPAEEHALTSGEVYTDMVARYRAKSSSIRDLAPTKCSVGCLNGGYLKKAEAK